MPHHNPKVQKFENDVRKAMKEHHEKKDKNEKATITRSALREFAKAEFKALREAVVAGQPTLDEAITHTESSIEAVIDSVEKGS